MVSANGFLCTAWTDVYRLFGILREQVMGCVVCKAVRSKVEEDLYLHVLPAVARGGWTGVKQQMDNFGSPDRVDAQTLCGNQASGERGTSSGRHNLRRVGPCLLVQLVIHEVSDYERQKFDNPRIEASPRVTVRVPEAVDFELVAAIEHHGRSMRSGHYVGYRRMVDGRWLVLNDDGEGFYPGSLRHGRVLTEAEFAARSLYCLILILEKQEAARQAYFYTQIVSTKRQATSV